MNISNASSAPAYQKPVPVNSMPAARVDHDGDADDRAGAVAKESAQAEAAESGRLNVLA